MLQREQKAAAAKAEKQQMFAAAKEIAERAAAVARKKGRDNKLIQREKEAAAKSKDSELQEQKNKQWRQSLEVGLQAIKSRHAIATAKQQAKS